MQFKVSKLRKAVILLSALMLTIITGCGGGGGSDPILLPASSLKAITSFSLAGVDGTINESAKTISVILPSDTEVKNLVATFTTTGASVRVGSTKQISGTSFNDFTNPIIYTVTAADGTTQDYVVTVNLFLIIHTPEHVLLIEPQEIRIKFSNQMDTSTVVLKIEPEIKGIISWNKENTELVFNYSNSTTTFIEYNISISKGAKDINGFSVLNEDYDFKLIGLPNKYISITNNNNPSDLERRFKLDEKGVIMVLYDQYGLQYNPVTIAQYALCLFDTYLETRDSTYKNKFLKQVAYLINPNNYKAISEDFIAHPYYIPMKSYGLDPPWYSAMASGQVTSVLIRAYYLNGDVELLNLAKKMIHFMIEPVENGGLTAKTPEGYIWFEEAPEVVWVLRTGNRAL